MILNVCAFGYRSSDPGTWLSESSVLPSGSLRKSLIEGRGHPAKCRVWERGQKSLGDLAKGMYSLLGNR